MGKIDQSFWDLIAAKLHHELDETDQVSFNEELEAEGKKSTFQKAEKIHDGLNAIKTLKGVDSDASWRMIFQRTRRTAFKRYATATFKYAAIILIAFFIGNYIQSFWQKDNNIQYAEIEVLNGQMGHLFLFDGTEVWLNSGSRFKYPNQFNQDERNVFLDGEAFFKVTPNKHLPFIVKTNKMEIEVLGTSFNVSSYHDEDQQSVVLEEGNVRINKENGQKIAELLPGQRASRNTKSSAFQIENIRTNFYTGWKEGKVVFESEQLGEIAKKLERWYNVDINFEKEELKKYQITGTILRNKPIDQTIRAIELLAPIRYEYITQVNKKDIINIKKK